MMMNVKLKTNGRRENITKHYREKSDPLRDINLFIFRVVLSYFINLTNPHTHKKEKENLILIK